MVRQFARDRTQTVLTFPEETTPQDKFMIHEIAEEFDLNHSSRVVNDKRVLVLTKPELRDFVNAPTFNDKANVLVSNQQAHTGQIDRLFFKIREVEKRLQKVEQQGPPARGWRQQGPGGPRAPQLISVPDEATPEQANDVPSAPWEPTLPPHDSTFRFVNWNIEWMDQLFSADDAHPTFVQEDHVNGISDAPALCRKIAGVIADMKPDVIAIEEGPSSIQKMRLFVTTYMNDNFDVFGGLDGAQQRIYILVRKDGPVKNAADHQPSTRFLAKEWMFDVNGTFELSSYKFTRTPVVVRGELNEKGKIRPVYFIALHTKSKFVAGGESAWTSKLPLKQMEFVKKSIGNRRRIHAELQRTRRCIDEMIFSESPDAYVVVGGDLNDGPGMDFFEEYFLLFDSVDALMGSPFKFKKMLRAVLIELADTKHPYSCVFDDYVDEIKSKKVLLDHIFITNALVPLVVNTNIAHDVFQKYYIGNEKRDQRPSDHRPVYCDFTIEPQ